MRDLELLPELPESDLRAWIAELGGVDVDGTCAVDFAESGLQCGESKADIFDAIVRNGLHGLFEDFTRLGGAVVGLDLLNVEQEDVVGFAGRNGAGGTIEHVHAVTNHTVFLFHLRVEKVELLAGFGRNGFETLRD